MNHPSNTPASTVATTTQVPSVKWTPADLIAWSRAERVFRDHERRHFGRNTWAVLRDDATYDTIGERIVRVLEPHGPTAAVCRITDLRQPPQRFDVELEKLAPAPAFGDAVIVDAATVGVALLPVAVPSKRGTITALVPQWKGDNLPTVVEPEGPYSPPTRRPAPETALLPVMDTAITTDAAGYFVRYVGSSGSVGPGLTSAMFCELASSVDPCLPRRDAGQVVSEEVSFTDNSKAVIRIAVLCDFAGGATLWIWADCLVANRVCGPLPWYLSPTWGRHPETSKIFRVGEARDATAKLVDTTRRLHEQAQAQALVLNPSPIFTFQSGALPAALTGDKPLTTDLISLLLCGASDARRDDIYILDEDYCDRLELAVKQIRDEWTQNDRDRCDLDDALSDLLGQDTSPGAYTVRSSGEVELPDGSAIATVKAQMVGYKNAKRASLVVGLLRPVSNDASAAVARRDEDGGGLARVGGVVARATKEVGGRALGAAKDAAIGAKDFAVDTVTRKGIAVAREVAQDTAVGGANMVRRGIGAAAEEMLGKEKGSIAEHPMFRHGFDFASVGALRVGGSLLAKVAPGFARTLSAGADTLEQGVDKQQARAVVDTVKPLATAGLMAIAQSAVAKFMPALAAPAAAAAIPEVTPEPAPAPAKPRARRKKTTDENGTPAK